jgi:hypothetical protein
LPAGLGSPLPISLSTERRLSLGRGKKAVFSNLWAKQLFTNRKNKAGEGKPKADSKISVEAEAEKMKFRKSLSAGSEQMHQTKRHPDKESVHPKRTKNFHPFK